MITKVKDLIKEFEDAQKILDEFDRLAEHNTKAASDDQAWMDEETEAFVRMAIAKIIPTDPKICKVEPVETKHYGRLVAIELSCPHCTSRTALTYSKDMAYGEDLALPNLCGRCGQIWTTNPEKEAAKKFFEEEENE